MDWFGSGWDKNLEMQEIGSTDSLSYRVDIQTKLTPWLMEPGGSMPHSQVDIQ